MISHKIDYLTISCLPGKTDWTVTEMLDKLLKALLIEDWLPWFVKVGSGYGYDEIYRFNDVSLKISSPHNYNRMGICLEFSGNGIAYYTEYLKLQRGITLRTALNRFRCLCQFGCKTKCSRIDWAIDEKCGVDDQRFLDLDRIQHQLIDRHFVSLFRKTDPERVSGELQSCYKVDTGMIDNNLPFTFIQSQDVSTGTIGKTIYLGKRRSGTYIRFYDKLAEQIAHKGSVPEGVKSWVRFEMEFHKHNAGSVLTKYLDSDSDEEFQDFICGLSLKLIRFVDPGRSRRYNCVTSKWWLDFLGNAKKANLTIHKPKRNKFLNFLLAFQKQYGATFSRAVKCCPDYLVSVLENGLKTSSKTADLISADYNAVKDLPPNYFNEELSKVLQAQSGEDYWRSFTDFDEREFNGRLSSLFRIVFNKEVGHTDLQGSI